MRVIGMIAPSWSGSTLWNLILDGLPGVTGVGEDHWIVDHRTFNRPYYCTECRDDPCSIFTPAALEEIADCAGFPGTWWPALAKATGCDIIVTSDKSPHHYERFGLPDICMVPYKDMRAHVASFVVNWLRKNKSIWDKSGTLMEDVNPTDAEVQEGIPWVVGNYNTVLDWAEGKGLPVHAVKLEDLALHPYRTLRATCAALGLPLDFTALDFTAQPHHHIGGNFSVRFHHGKDYPTKGVERTYAHQWQEKFKGRIALDDKWKSILTPSQAEAIMQDERALALETRFRRLRCREDDITQ